MAQPRANTTPKSATHKRSTKSVPAGVLGVPLVTRIEMSCAKPSERAQTSTNAASDSRAAALLNKTVGLEHATLGCFLDLLNC